MVKIMTTPKGVRDFLPEEAAWKRILESRINKVFTSFGYREVVTPTIEHLAVFTKGSELDEKMYRFVDREGEILALRPDMTTPIARVVSGRLKDEPLPLRLCYSGNLFRYDEPQAGRQREFYQAGVELVGGSSPEADAEVVALAYYSLAAAGVKNFRIDLGHMGYVGGLLAELALNEEEISSVRRCLIHKDLVGLEENLRSVRRSRKQHLELLEVFLSLPRLRGGLEILNQAAQLSKNPVSEAALANLSAIYTALKQYGIEEAIVIDLSMVKEMDYYTGMILEGYSREMGYYLCSGGRYDNLLAQFGFPAPATGFALGVDRVLLVLERQNSSSLFAGPRRFKIFSPGGWTKKRIAWVMERRLAGFLLEMVFSEVVPDNAENSLVFISDERLIWHSGDGAREVSLPQAAKMMAEES